MSEADFSDAELIASIAPDVMKYLGSRGFFERLDDLFCPTDPSRARQQCTGNHEVSMSILKSQGLGEAEIENVCAVFAAQGGCCDCEVLYNMVETSRLKAEYWRAQLEGGEPPSAHRNSK